MSLAFWPSIRSGELTGHDLATTRELSGREQRVQVLVKLVSTHTERLIIARDPRLLLNSQLMSEGPSYPVGNAQVVFF